jgi:16S rRNA (guanine(966)-N(2))-methyltransferase RsmD
VIAGKHRSRKLKMVDDKLTRETKDRVKESLFNMIGPYQEMHHVLDLFAGSGSLGIEALSRGGKKAVFVDSFLRAQETIQSNLKNLSLQEQSLVYKLDAFAYLDQAKESFDLIFLDPPYHTVDLDKVLQTIGQKKLLNKEGLILVLMDQTEELKESEYFQIVKEKRITRTKLVFLKWGS